MANELQKLLLKYPDKDWDWEYVSWNPNIDLEFIIENSNLPWKWKWISANPNITMYDNKVRGERSVIRIDHDNSHDLIVNILREHGVAESLPPRDGVKFSRVSSIKPKSRRKSRKAVHFGIDSIRSIPKIGIYQTPPRTCATRVNMSKRRQDVLDYSLQRAILASKRGH